MRLELRIASTEVSTPSESSGAGVIECELESSNKCFPEFFSLLEKHFKLLN